MIIISKNFKAFFNKKNIFLISSIPELNNSSSQRKANDINNDLFTITINNIVSHKEGYVYYIKQLRDNLIVSGVIKQYYFMIIHIKKFLKKK